MTSDILTFHNVPASAEQAAAYPQVQGWTPLEQGVCWQGDAHDCVAAATIDIVGVADLPDFKAHFLLLP